MQTVYIFADESCLGNGKKGATPGGAGGVVGAWTGTEWIRRDYWTSSPDTTNNQMAIQSAIIPLAALSRPCRVIFISDSEYLVRGMNEWIKGWVRRGWVNAAKEPVKNAELWKQLLAAASRHEVSFHWVRGHAGHPQNSYADYLATQAASTQTTTDGFVSSRFLTWLESERSKGRLVEFDENAAPEII